MLNYEIAHNLLRYEDGMLFWRSSLNGSAGNRAGYVTDRGYRNVYIMGRHYREHRIVWLMHHGVMPTGQIDHIDGDRLNNRIENMRDVTSALNLRNAKLNRRNKSGVMGVTWSKGKWRVQVTENYLNKRLGSFETIFDAAAARKSYEARNGYHANHGRNTAQEPRPNGQ